VRAGEGVTTVMLAVTIFLFLAGYSLMKPARDGLILTEGGAEVASYSAAAQAVLLMVLVPIYGWLGTRVVRITLITIRRDVLRRDPARVLRRRRRGTARRRWRSTSGSG
jgi:AAA family ATP:ADP antiporter